MNPIKKVMPPRNTMFCFSAIEVISVPCIRKAINRIDAPIIKIILPGSFTFESPYLNVNEY